MKKIGVIGLGGIAQKAYLPVMMTMSDEVEWHFYTRNQEKLAQIGKQYRVEKLYSTIEQLIESGITMAFVHTATETHGQIIKQLLENKIHVYVDKPISENLEEVKELMELASEKKVQLVTGFNRRFAPMIQKLKAVPDKNMLFIQKNKTNSQTKVQRGIYDMFIHVLDTAVYLLDEPILKTSYHLKTEGEYLKNCVMEIITENSICIASMNYMSGANTETAEVMSTVGGTHRVVNLTEYEGTQNGEKTIIEFGDWETTLEKRGFAPIIRKFIEGVETGEAAVSMESALTSHQLCQKIVTGEIRHTL
ncbi:Gfo/Idh/MocA family protein [Carnobacterium divergens]|uniref:Gfo/Idh/MocA family protein n=1 Tax=Carnobacterium divergens TaxID=2748 RepID=UPI0039AEBA87